MPSRNSSPTRLTLLAVAASTTAATAAAQPASSGLRFEHLATIEHMGRIDVNRVTGTIAVGTTGPHGSAPYAIRTVSPDGTVQTLGAPVPDPDAVVWDVNGVFAEPGSVLVGGVGGIFAVGPAGATSLVFEAGSDFFNPESMAITPAGDLLIADYNNARVQRADAQGSFTTAASSFAPINQVAVSPVTGEILFGDQDGYITGLASSGRLLSDGSNEHLTGLAFGDGSARWGSDAYAVDAVTGDLLRFDGDESSVIATGLFEDADMSIFNGAGIGFLPGGDMVIGVPATDTLWRVVPTPGTGALLALGGLAALRRRR